MTRVQPGKPTDVRRGRDPRGRHVRIYCDLLNSHAWRCLSFSARALFVDLRASLGKNNNGDVSAAYSDLRHRGWRSKTVLARSLHELLALGFIDRTRTGGVEFGSKVCSLYAFTDIEVYAMPSKGVEARNVTHAYRDFATITEAQTALLVGVEALHDRARAKWDSARQAAAKRRSQIETVSVLIQD